MRWEGVLEKERRGVLRRPHLLPAGSEEHEVLQTGSIHVAILPSCQFLYNSAF